MRTVLVKKRHNRRREIAFIAVTCVLGLALALGFVGALIGGLSAISSSGFMAGAVSGCLTGLVGSVVMGGMVGILVVTE